MQPGEGIMPAHALTIGGFNQVGQALSWDFKLFEPGKYEVAVVSFAEEGQEVDQSGRLKATVAGQSVENQLNERTRMKNPRMASHFEDSMAILGQVTIETAGTHTLSLEVTSVPGDSNRRLRHVMLLPLDWRASKV